MSLARGLEGSPRPHGWRPKGFASWWRSSTSSPGGYAHHFLRKVRGTKTVYDFDVALHQTGDLKPGRKIHDILSKLGVLQRIRLREFDIAYRTRGPDHDLQIPADADAYEDLLCDAFPDAAPGVRDLFQLMRDFDAPSEAGGINAAGLACMDQSLAQVMDAHVSDERVQTIFSTLWGYLGLVPAKASAFVYGHLWSTFHFGGCFYIEGGGQALSNAFVDVIEAHRGRVVLRSEVLAIETEAGRVIGVETRRQGKFRAPIVVSNAAAPLTFHQLLDTPSLAKSDLERVDELPVACSIQQTYVGMRGDASKLGLPDRTMFFVRSYDYDEEARALESGDYAHQGWTLSNHTIADPTHVPQGRSIVHAAIMAEGRLWEGLSEASYLERKRELESFLVDRIADAIPDVRDRIEVCETGTPHTMERYSWNPSGSIYGYASAPSTHSVHRPQPRTSVPGLYLAGAWTFPAAGFTGTMLSGWNTGQLVLDDVAQT